MINRSLLCAVALLLSSSAVACGGGTGPAGNTSCSAGKLLDEAHVPAGKTFDAWTTDWWLWYNTTLGPDHPFLDPDGRWCDVGQDPASPVYFLSGVASTGVAKRTCSVPHGKPVLIGVQHGSVDNACLPPAMFSSREALCAENKKYMVAVDAGSVSATIDGCPIERSAMHRQECFDLGPYTIPPGDNIYVEQGNKGCMGDVAYSYASGYWLMLAPLPPGKHDVAWTSQVGGTYNFDVNVHYTLNVE